MATIAQFGLVDKIVPNNLDICLLCYRVLPRFGPKLWNEVPRKIGVVENLNNFIHVQNFIFDKKIHWKLSPHHAKVKLAQSERQ